MVSTETGAGMPVKPGTPLDPSATRARVLNVAATLFYERGVHAVGVSEIAERAEASKLTIYRHFGSKAGLIEAVLGERSDKIHRWLATNTEAAKPGRARILALFDLLTGWYAEQGFRGCSVVNAVTDTRDGHEGHAAVGTVARAHLARYRELLERCLVDAGVTDPPTVARQLLLLIEGATVITTIDADTTAGTDARRVAELLIDAATPRRRARA